MHFFNSIFIILVLISSTKSYEDLAVVSNFDVNKYMGHWYLISSFVSFVDFYCSCSQVNYTLDPQNSLRVNFEEYCRIFSIFSPYKHSFRYAEIDKNESAKWTVYNEFIAPISLRNDYWIIGLDGEKYQWALIGSRNRQSLYVLSRNQTINDDIYNDIKKIAYSKHFDATRLAKTSQNCKQ